jgi:hypothetical protein
MNRNFSPFNVRMCKCTLFAPGAGAAAPVHERLTLGGIVLPFCSGRSESGGRVNESENAAAKNFDGDQRK